MSDQWPGTKVEPSSAGQWPGTPVEKAQESGGGFMDQIKSIPGGLLSGFMTSAAQSGQAAQIEMGEPVTVPGGEEATKTVEREVTGELPKSGKYGRAIGEVLGNPASYVGPGSLALKAGAGVATALGSEAAGQLVGEGSPLEGPARLAGGVLAGGSAGLASAERSLSGLASRLPTREIIKDAATAGYEMLKKSGTTISPEGTTELMGEIQRSLHEGNFRDYLEPATFRAIQELGTGENRTVGQIDTVRKLLLRVPKTNPSEGEAARRAVDAIDDFLINVPEQFVMSGNPATDAAILKHAQRNWALHKQLETLEEATTKAQRRAASTGTGANRINTARQEVRKILDSDKKSRGLSDEVKNKMEEIVLGTWMSNKTRTLSKFAPTGPVSIVGPLLTGEVAGGAAGASLATGGFLAKHLGEYLTDRQMKQLEQLMRSESPIGRPIAREIAPEIAEQKMVPAATAARSALTSPLAPSTEFSQPQQ